MAREDDRTIRQEVERRLQEIQLLEQEAKDQGQRSRFLPQQELARKVRSESSDSPYILGAAWYSPVPLGGSAGVRVYVANSDPTPFSYLLVTLFFDGVSNFLSDIGSVNPVP